MSIVAVHFRWTDVSPQQYEQLLCLLAKEREGPFECLSQRSHRLGKAVLATAVWESEIAADQFRLRLIAACENAGLVEPRIAVVSVPAMFLGGYRRAPAEVPRQRPALSAPAQAPTTPAALPG